MKYKPSDKVRIKSIDWYNENKDKFGNIRYKRDGSAYPVFFSKYMSNFCGEILTIKSVFNHSYHMNETSSCEFWTDEMIEGLVKEETKFGTASNPIEPKSNANHLTQKRVDELATKIDKELPSGNQNVWELSDGYQFVDENGNVINATKIVLEKKKKEYPKSYEECLNILGYNIAHTIPMNHGHNGLLIMKLQRLLIYRDAYWKIAGEEMGLGKPWEPDWEGEGWYVIVNHRGDIVTDIQWHANAILAFPTEEMRDAFKENFGPDIEICKEFL